MKQLAITTLFFTCFSLFGASQKAVTKEDVLKAKAAHKEGIVALLADRGFPKEIAKLVAAYDPWSLENVMAIGFNPRVEEQYLCNGCRGSWVPEHGEFEANHSHAFAESWKEPVTKNNQETSLDWRGQYNCLDVSGLGLESLHGIKSIFPYRLVRVLDAANNALTNVDCDLIEKSMPTLKFLNLSKNALKKFPLVALRRGATLQNCFLTHVNLSDNPGLQLDEPLNPSLLVVHASNCGFTQLTGNYFADGNGEPCLRTLVLDGNELTEIPVELRKLRSLQRVFAERNRLSSPQPLSHGTIHSANQKTVASTK